MLVLKNTAHFERYLRAIFDNRAKMARAIVVTYL